jgi:hypothetical protein
MAKELGHSEDWVAQQIDSFRQLAQQYLVM